LQKRFSLDDLLQQLPNALHADITRYVFAKDQYVHALGKYLLKQQLATFDIDSEKLTQLQQSPHHKPQILGVPLQFNISHSHELVVCAASSDVRLGIDVEHMAPINVDNFRSCFTANEWQYIKQDQGLDTFFELWTKKESVMKADGRGMAIPLEAIDTLHKPVIIEGDSQRWFLQMLELDANYKACICTAQKRIRVNLNEIV
jgi:4'-phosphopantetheinyl transferase